MNIYEIDAAILALVDEETGEILDWEQFDALQMAREEKIDNVMVWYKNLAAEATAIKAEEDALKARRRRIEAQAQQKLQYLEDALCGQAFQSARGSISFRKTTRVDLEDEEACVEWLQRAGRDDALTYTAPKVNKNELARLLKAGMELPGAALVNGLSMGVK